MDLTTWIHPQSSAIGVPYQPHTQSFQQNNLLSTVDISTPTDPTLNN
jgi:hypothetical protein